MSSPERVYALYTEHPPYKNGRKNRGSKCASAFWHGYGEGPRPTYISRGSTVFAAWKAGRDTRFKEMRKGEYPRYL